MTIQYVTSEECIILTRLGLTLNEARVLLALYASENLTAKTIAKSSGVAREIVYQIIPKLQKKGLVDELVTSPKTFKAIPLEHVIQLLLQQRKKEDNYIFAKAQEIAKKQQQLSKVKNDDSNITIIAPKKSNLHWKKDWVTYQYSVDLVMPTNKFLQWPHFYAENSIDDAMQKNAKMRMITDKTTQTIIEHPPAKYFSQNLSLKLNYLHYRFAEIMPVEIVIFDRKVLYISTSDEKQVKDMVWLRSNNPFLLEMANSYFENWWSNSEEQLKKKIIAKKAQLIHQI
jgi:sugar-specific transcriptional regulator TrmB